MSAIFLAFMAWILVDIARHDPDAESDAREVEPTVGLTAPIEDFLVFADADPGQGVPPVGPAHEYTALGIIKLTAALEALDSTAGRLNTVQLDELARRADALRADSRSLEHADIVRGVFASITEMLGTMTEADVAELRAAADAIDPDRPLLQQANAVRQFFRGAAKVILDSAQ